MSKVIATIAVVALAAAVVVGLGQAGSDGGGEDAVTQTALSLEDALEQLEGAPPELAALHDESNALLGGGTAAVRARLRDVRGRPVVLNKWASWCGPCRFEFPFFARAAARRGKEIAFIGLNSGDNAGDARNFLKRFPVPFPSYVDPDEKVARDLGVPANYPITVFYDARGEEVFTHQGGYPTLRRLEDDIARYLPTG